HLRVDAAPGPGHGDGADLAGVGGQARGPVPVGPRARRRGSARAVAAMRASKARAGRRLNRWLAVVLVLVGVLAPLLANQVPLVGGVGGVWSSPAFASYLGPVPPGPGDLTWKQWRQQLPADSADFAWLPPCPYGPRETDLTRIGAGPSRAHPLGNDDT